MPKIKITTEEKKKRLEKKLKRLPSKTPKKKITSGVLHIEATFNNTKILLADKSGNSLFWASAGSLGFQGAKKGTPFAASKVGDVIGSKASVLGVERCGCGCFGSRFRSRAGNSRFYGSRHRHYFHFGRDTGPA